MFPAGSPPVVPKFLVVAHVVEGAAGDGLGLSGDPCLHRPLDVGRESRRGQALVEILRHDVADQVVAIGGVGHDGQLDRHLHTRVHLVEGDFPCTERHGPGLCLRAAGAGSARCTCGALWPAGFGTRCNRWTRTGAGAAETPAGRRARPGPRRAGPPPAPIAGRAGLGVARRVRSRAASGTGWPAAWPEPVPETRLEEGSQ